MEDADKAAPQINRDNTFDRNHRFFCSQPIVRLASADLLRPTKTKKPLKISGLFKIQKKIKLT
jgi:hypothetical protein